MPGDADATRGLIMLPWRFICSFTMVRAITPTYFAADTIATCRDTTMVYAAPILHAPQRSSSRLPLYARAQLLAICRLIICAALRCAARRARLYARSVLRHDADAA